MLKIKKIHKIICLFILIFLLGIYSFTFYINDTIDKKTETSNKTEIKNNFINSDREATQIN